jgi:hypothetical protein
MDVNLGLESEEHAARYGRMSSSYERACHLGEEVLGDLGEHRRVELLLLREVVDDGRQR